jgi:hypothetical protein
MERSNLCDWEATLSERQMTRDSMTEGSNPVTWREVSSEQCSLSKQQHITFRYEKEKKNSVQLL